MGDIFIFQKNGLCGLCYSKNCCLKVELGSFTRRVLGKQPQDAFSFDISMRLNGCNYFFQTEYDFYV